MYIYIYIYYIYTYIHTYKNIVSTWAKSADMAPTVLLLAASCASVWCVCVCVRACVRVCLSQGRHILYKEHILYREHFLYREHILDRKHIHRYTREDTGSSKEE